jgi:hypothetical protein
MHHTSLRAAKAALFALPLILSACGGGSNEVASATSARLLPEVAASEIISIEGNSTDYTITPSATGVTVTSLNGQATQVPAGIKRLWFNDRVIALDTEGVAGQAYRLYQAAFDRQPDIGGLGVNISAMEAGNQTLEMVAAYFVISPEFTSRYGQLDNTAFVTRLYANVLDRAPDPQGLAFHVGHLNTGRYNRAQTLIHFSESPENKTKVSGAIANGMVFIPASGVRPPPQTNPNPDPDPNSDPNQNPATPGQPGQPPLTIDPPPNYMQPAEECVDVSEQNATGVRNCRRITDYTRRLLPGTYTGKTTTASNSAECSVTLTPQGVLEFRQATGAGTEQFNVWPAPNPGNPNAGNEWNALVSTRSASDQNVTESEEYRAKDSLRNVFGHIKWHRESGEGPYSAFGASTNPLLKSFTCNNMHRTAIPPTGETRLHLQKSERAGAESGWDIVHDANISVRAVNLDIKDASGNVVVPLDFFMRVEAVNQRFRFRFEQRTAQANATSHFGLRTGRMLFQIENRTTKTITGYRFTLEDITQPMTSPPASTIHPGYAHWHLGTNPEATASCSSTTFCYAGTQAEAKELIVYTGHGRLDQTIANPDGQIQVRGGDGFGIHQWEVQGQNRNFDLIVEPVFAPN